MPDKIILANVFEGSPFNNLPTASSLKLGLLIKVVASASVRGFFSTLTCSGNFI